jgi:hypothetical protein
MSSVILRIVFPTCIFATAQVETWRRVLFAPQLVKAQQIILEREFEAAVWVNQSGSQELDNFHIR